MVEEIVRKREDNASGCLVTFGEKAQLVVNQICREIKPFAPQVRFRHLVDFLGRDGLRQRVCHH